ncbi:MAG: cytochrome c-type biogenesis protein CcmH [Anaerolineales bacterium]
MRRLMIIGGLLAMLAASVAGVRAQFAGEDLPPGVQGEDVYRVSSEIYCDVCEGVPVSDCPTATCAGWRQEIANLLGEGYSDQAIVEEMTRRYGDEVSPVPVDRERRLVALGLPIALIVVIGLGMGWQVWRLRAYQQSRAQVAAAQAGDLPGYVRPVPDNVDPVYLTRFLKRLEDD